MTHNCLPLVIVGAYAGCPTLAVPPPPIEIERLPTVPASVVDFAPPWLAKSGTLPARSVGGEAGIELHPTSLTHPQIPHTKQKLKKLKKLSKQFSAL